MPIRADDAGPLANLLGNDGQLCFWHSTHIDLDMNLVIGAEFGDDSTRNAIQVLKTLDDTSDGAGVCVSNDPQASWLGKSCALTRAYGS